VEGLTNTLCSSSGKKVGSVPYSLTDPNQQFRIEKKDDKYYLYSVGAGKYISGNGSYEDAASTALKMENVDGAYPWKLIIGSNGLNSQDGGQTDSGIAINSYTTTDAGNCYQIVEAGAEPTPEPTPDFRLLNILSIDKAEVALEEGESMALVVRTGHSFATDHSVTWSSSDPAIATVDSEGVVTAVSVGSAIITVAANDASGLKATCVVTVKEAMSVENIVMGENSGAIYDMQGRRVLNPSKGIYIMGNKKVVIK
jgi:hypothetical protein